VDVQYRPTEVEGEVHWHKFSLSDYAAAELAASLDGSVMILGACGYMLQELIRSLKSMGLPFENSFRRKRMDWNPLWQSKKKGAGVRTITRLNAFANCPNWTAGDILLWEKFTKGVFTKEDREILRQLPQEEKLTAQQLQDVLGDHASAAIFDDYEWLRENLNKQSQDKLGYYFNLIKRYPKGYYETPGITVGTIHSVKGGECDHVILSPDISYEAFQNQQWGEINRTFYVAVTRARKSVHLLAPTKHRTQRYLSPHIEWPESLDL
jgi:hypothetical protein